MRYLKIPTQITRDGYARRQCGIGGQLPVTAMFVPPEHSTVPDALEDLVAFMQRTDIPAMAQAAIAHAQFETIHPFTDGNGLDGSGIGICDTALPRHNAELHCAFIVRAAHQHERLF